MEKPVISCVWTHWAMDEDRSLLARASLESLLTSGRSWPFEALVVDNGGSYDDSRWLLSLADRGKVALYVRNAQNRSFGYARNQALQDAHGEYVLVVDNDIVFPLGAAWVSALLEPFQAFPGEEIITSPFRYTDERQSYKAANLGKWETNLRAGSNCFLARRSLFEEVGFFTLHRIAGSLFTDALVRAGYRTVIVPGTGITDHGLRKGYNLKKPLEINVPLTDGTSLRML